MILFVAVAPDRDTARILHSGAWEASSLHWGNKTSPELAEDLHITLRYLGEREDVEDVIARLSEVKHPSFALEVSHYGIFDNPGDKVLWAGVDGATEALHTLKRAVDRALGFGEESPPQPFIPHITLAYAGKDAPVDPEALPPPGRSGFGVDGFSLYRVLPESSSCRFACIATFPLAGREAHRKVNVLCVNDFHATIFENSAGVGATKLAGVIRQYKTDNPHTLVVFGGDNYFGDPVCDHLGGRPVSRLMAEVGTAASVIGNHEFDYGTQAITNWQTEGGFPFLGANVVERATGEIPPFLKPYVMVECGGINVALIGLATEEELATSDRPAEMKDYVVTDGTSAALRWMEHLRQGRDPLGKPDVVIALTHFGLREGREGEVVGEEMQALCRALPELSGAFAAHWHQFIRVNIGGVPVAEGGSTGRGFALLSISLDEEGRVLGVEPDYIDLMPLAETLPEDEAVKAELLACLEEAGGEMNRVVALAEEDIHHRHPLTNAIDPLGTPLTLLVTRLMRETCDSEVALLYAGRMGKGFEKGPVTLYWYYQTMMFRNGLVTMSLSGEDLRRNLETGLRTLKGEGASPLAVEGLNVLVDFSQPHGQRLLDVTLPDGAPLSPHRYYKVVMDDYLAHDPFGFDFSGGKDRKYLTLSARELLLEHLERTGRVTGEKPDNVRASSESG